MDQRFETNSQITEQLQRLLTALKGPNGDIIFLSSFKTPMNRNGKYKLSFFEFFISKFNRWLEKRKSLFGGNVPLAKAIDYNMLKKRKSLFCGNVPLAKAIDYNMQLPVPTGCSSKGEIIEWIYNALVNVTKQRVEIFTLAENTNAILKIVNTFYKKKMKEKYQSVIQAIPVSGSLLLRSFDGVDERKIYHITIDYDTIHCDVKTHNVVIIGSGNFIDPSDSQKYSWFVVSINGKKENKSGGFFHITITAPQGKASKIGALAADNRYSTFYSKEDCIDLGKLLEVPLAKRSMPDGITNEHWMPFFDFDNTLINTCTDQLSPEMKTNFAYLREPCLLLDQKIVQFGPLFHMILRQSNFVQIITSRRMDEETRLKFERSIEKIAIKNAKNVHIKVSFSVQSEKLKGYGDTRKEQQALDKEKRMNQFDGYGIRLFFDDDDVVIDHMINRGLHAVHVKKSFQQLEFTYHRPENLNLPIAFGLCCGIGGGKSSLIQKIREHLEGSGHNVELISTDQINKEKKLEEEKRTTAYNDIQRIYSQSHADYFIVDTTLTSGELPIPGMHVIYLDPVVPYLMSAITFTRALFRIGHFFAPPEEVSKILLPEFNKIDLVQHDDDENQMNVGPQDDPEDFINSFPNFTELEKWFAEKSHMITKKNFGLNSQPMKGSFIVVAYLHDGAKNFKEMGLNWRHPAFVFDGDKWILFKLPFQGGAEVNSVLDPISKMHPLHKQVAKMLEKDDILPEGSRMSWKWDGQFFKLTVLRGKVAKLLQNYLVRSDNCVAQILLNSSVNDLGNDYLIILSTNGTAIVEDREMIRNFITAICGSENMDTNSLHKMTIVDAFNFIVVPWISKKFVPLYQETISRKTIHSDVVFGMNFEATMENRVNPWSKYSTLHELACNEPSRLTCIGVDIDGKFHPQFVDEISSCLTKHGICQSESIGNLSGKKVRRLIKCCEELITMTRDQRQGELTRLLSEFGFKTKEFHPEGFVLFVPIDGKWIYCKVKIPAYYLAHKSDHRKLAKLLSTYPEDAGDFFPAIKEAYANMEALKYFIPAIIQGVHIFMSNLLNEFIERVTEAETMINNNFSDFSGDINEHLVEKWKDKCVIWRQASLIPTASRAVASMVKLVNKTGTVPRFNQRVIHIKGIADLPLDEHGDCSSDNQELFRIITVACLDGRDDEMSDKVNGYISTGDVKRNVFYSILKMIVMNDSITIDDIRTNNDKDATKLRELILKLSRQPP